MIDRHDDVDGIIEDQEILASEEFSQMPSEELLSVWEHTQNMEMDLRSRFGNYVMLAPDYEKMIVNELHSRLLNNTLQLSLPKFEKKKMKRPRQKRICPSPKFSRG